MRRLGVWLLCLTAGFYAWLGASLVLLRFIDPPTTALQMERRLQALLKHAKYNKRYEFAPLSDISPALQHAVIAAEDARFYQHHGIDWKEVSNAIDDAEEGGRVRGASTITQQLLKNLFLTDTRCPLRKAVEWTMAAPAEMILSKQRILELYLNVIEWGPGVYGAEAAARYHYRTVASKLGRDQAARLAAVIPSPARRRPARMERYSGAIQNRMTQMGW
jgi:monofunctional glycosyltransferase